MKKLYIAKYEPLIDGNKVFGSSEDCVDKVAIGAKFLGQGAPKWAVQKFIDDDHFWAGVAVAMDEDGNVSGVVYNEELKCLIQTIPM